MTGDVNNFMLLGKGMEVAEHDKLELYLDMGWRA